MHLEDSQDSISLIEELLNKRTGLSGDSINAFMLLGSLDQELPERDRDIYFESATSEPIPLYVEYLKEKNPAIAESFLAKSSLSQVAEFDRLVQQFNDSRIRIREQKDYQAVIAIWRAARKLILDK